MTYDPTPSATELEVTLSFEDTLAAAGALLRLSGVSMPLVMLVPIMGVLSLSVPSVASVVTELLFVVAEVTVEVIAVVASVSLPPVESLVPVLESLELPLTPEVPLLPEPPLVELADSPPVLLPESESESVSAAVALSSSPLLSQPRPPRPRTRAAEIVMFRPCRVMGGPYHRSPALALWRVCQAPDSDVMAVTP